MTRMALSTMQRTVLAAMTLLLGAEAFAAVLPEDRADALYHRYSGGGITIDGPSVLVRKKVGEKFSVSANYYLDMVSSASIDVQSGASAYEEERKQISASADFLRGKTLYSLGFINSDESDYEANTGYVSLSQDMFGDLTTVSMTFKRGWDDVYRNTRFDDGSRGRDPAFAETTDKRSYALGLSQILTRNMILALNYEVQTDEGFLNNPYRQVRYATPGVGKGWSQQAELYPHTHTSNAVAGRLKYYLPYRAAVEGMYRFYTDTWGVQAHTVELGYTHPAFRRWIFDGRVRYYKQDAADFYSDLFPRPNFANFIARDKELSTYQAYTFGVGASYEFTVPRAPWIQRSTMNVRFDHLFVDYEDFRDARVTLEPGSGVLAGAEPLYQLDANVMQVFLSIWF